MTGSFPPWSPLNDPQLYARLQEKLGSSQENARRKAQFQLDLLSRYAWQEYPVKYGCWTLSQTGLTGGTNLSGPWTKRAYTADYSWILLLDPASGRPIARHQIDTAFDGGATVKAVPFNSQATRSIWFAGDARVCGMFAPVGGGQLAYFGSRPGARGAFKAWQQGPQQYAHWSATIADALDSGAAAAAEGEVLWIADHPQKPAAPGRFSSAGH